jgi:hypothetical protein
LCGWQCGVPDICAGEPVILLVVALSCIVNAYDHTKRFTVLGETRYLRHGAMQRGLLYYGIASIERMNNSDNNGNNNYNNNNFYIGVTHGL